MNLQKNIRGPDKKLKNKLIGDNLGRTELVIDVLKGNNEKNHKTEIIVTKDDHETKTYFSVLFCNQALIKTIMI